MDTVYNCIQMRKPISYLDAGVSIDVANEAVKRIGDLARSTFNERTLNDIGSFGGMFDAKFPDMSDPVLVSSADGVGTKLKLAFEMNKHGTIGQDLVNHCVGDILAQGAKPLFFLDYFAAGKLSADVISSVVEGLSTACKENGCVLLGGETAEMPGFYAKGEYDLAGFIVGVVDKFKVVTGEDIKAGDIILGLPSTGLHTNGYSLARKLFFEIGGYRVGDKLKELGEKTLGEALLKPHRSYLSVLEGLLDNGIFKGLAHITGGGLLQNIPRILPENTSAAIKCGTWEEPSIFSVMKKLGNVDRDEMFRAFNMGIGMTMVCAPDDKGKIISHVKDLGEVCFEIGMVVEGKGKVILV